MSVNSTQCICFDKLHFSISLCVQVTDVFEFLPSTVPGGSLQFLCCSESTGYRHLYLVTATPPGESFSQVLKAECSTQQLTTGNWVVFGSKVSLQTYQSKLCTVLRICAHTHAYTHACTCTCTYAQIWVDSKHQVVFFEANVTSPLEKHL